MGKLRAAAALRPVNLFYDASFQKDPPLLFTHGWNEWIVQRFKCPDGRSYFMDQFNADFSKDIEPINDIRNAKVAQLGDKQ